MPAVDQLEILSGVSKEDMASLSNMQRIFSEISSEEETPSQVSLMMTMIS